MLPHRILLLAGTALIVCVSWRSERAETIKNVRPLHNPALPGSMAPSLSATSDGKVILSWLEPVDASLALRFAVWDGNVPR